MELEVGVGTKLGIFTGRDVTGKLMRGFVMMCFFACFLVLWVCDHAFHL